MRILLGAEARGQIPPWAPTTAPCSSLPAVRGAFAADHRVHRRGRHQHRGARRPADRRPRQRVSRNPHDSPPHRGSSNSPVRGCTIWWSPASARASWRPRAEWRSVSSGCVTRSSRHQIARVEEQTTDTGPARPSRTDLGQAHPIHAASSRRAMLYNGYRLEISTDGGPTPPDPAPHRRPPRASGRPRVTRAQHHRNPTISNPLRTTTEAQ